MGHESKTFSLTIAEMREFAGFAEYEQEFIERSLDIALGRCDAFKTWSVCPEDKRAIRGQYLAYRGLKHLRALIPDGESFDGVESLMGTLLRISAQDLAMERLDSFSAYRFLYERLLGAALRAALAQRVLRLALRADGALGPGLVRRVELHVRAAAQDLVELVQPDLAW